MPALPIPLGLCLCFTCMCVNCLPPAKALRMGEPSTSTSLGTFIMKEVTKLSKPTTCVGVVHKKLDIPPLMAKCWFQGRPPSIEVKIEMAMVDSSRARTLPSKKFGSRPSFPLSCDPSRPSFWERRPTCPKTPRIYKRLKDGPLHSHVRT